MCMQEKEVKKHHRIKKAVLIVGGLIFAAVIGFLIYAADYYPADETAVAVLQMDETIKTEGNLTILTPEEPGDTAFIFYPGAKVEETAYLPILEKLKNQGITCVLVKMPLHMAIFDKNAADKVYEKLPEIKHWYVGGHSMGGAMASAYASKNQEKVEGLILLGAYVYGDYPPEKALTIYGSLNADVGKKIDYTENIVVIEGGNHAQFGNYGRQKGDLDATISSEEQQETAVEEMIDFMK